jgi:hypothetical protein
MNETARDFTGVGQATGILLCCGAGVMCALASNDVWQSSALCVAIILFMHAHDCFREGNR